MLAGVHNIARFEYFIWKERDFEREMTMDRKQTQNYKFQVGFENTHLRFNNPPPYQLHHYYIMQR